MTTSTRIGIVEITQRDDGRLRIEYENVRFSESERLRPNSCEGCCFDDEHAHLTCGRANLASRSLTGGDCTDRGVIWRLDWITR